MSMSISQPVGQIANVRQAELWNGSDGQHWAEHAEHWDALSHGCDDYLFGAASITATDRVLDIGCGNGQTTRLAARQAYDGHVIGVDLSDPMLATARRLAEQDAVDNLRFELADAQVHPFTDAGFDVAISRFGVMFFADPVAGFANVGRALRPAGRLAFACPAAFDADDASVRVIFRTLEELLPSTGTPEPPVADPTSLSDPDRTAELLTAAGFVEPDAWLVEYPMTLGRDAVDAADFVLGWGLVRIRLWDADRATVERVRSGFVDAFSSYESVEGVQLPAHTWIVTANREGS